MGPKQSDVHMRAREGSGTTKATGDSSYGSLRDAIKSSYMALDPFRSLNRKMVESYVGPTYGSAQKRLPKYLNKVRQSVIAHMVLLGGSRPHVNISSDYLALTAFSHHFQINLNNLLKEIVIEKTLRRWIFDSFMCMGVCKLHLADSGYVANEGDLSMDPGSPFASNVLLDDYVYDVTASNIEAARFQGDMYQITMDDLKQGVEDGMYDKKVADTLTPDRSRLGQGHRADELIGGAEVNQSEYDPPIDVADIWIAKEGQIKTFPVLDRSTFEIRPNPLGGFPWKGPELGPFVLLQLDEVSGEVMPTSTAGDIEPLDRLANLIMNKQANKARRAKNVNFFAPGSEEDAKRGQQANDGDLVCSDNPDGVVPRQLGGIDPSLQAFLQDTLGMLDTQGGNITAMLGLGAQTDTVGQEQLIHGASNRRGGALQYRVLAATNQLISGLGQLMWADEFKEIASTIPVAGQQGKQVDSSWKPGDREGNFIQYNLEVATHSMAFQPPSEKVQAINGLLQNVYLPLQEQVAQQGGQIDFSRLTDIYAEMLNIPQLHQIVRFDKDVKGKEDQPKTSTRSKQGETTRNYVRQSVSNGGTEEGKRIQSQQNWTGVASANGDSNGAGAY